MLENRFITSKIFLAVLLAVEPALFNPFPQAFVMNEVTALQPSQKGFGFVVAHHAF